MDFGVLFLDIFDYRQEGWVMFCCLMNISVVELQWKPGVSVCGFPGGCNENPSLTYIPAGRLFTEFPVFFTASQLHCGKRWSEGTNASRFLCDVHVKHEAFLQTVQPDPKPRVLDLRLLA